VFTTNAFAAPAAGAPPGATTIQRREVGPRDVLIDIAYCGICHTDIHTVGGEWGSGATRSCPVTRSPGWSRRRRRGHQVPGR
jgi:D-arabinose 1-dehydrogenase-like Zn-dependent alcohol dehydrogenase